MAKQGFKGQWIEIAKVGKFRDSKGVERDLTPDLLASIAANFNTGQEAPITIGHPKHAAPAYGWISQLRMSDNALEMMAEDTADEFEEMVRDGRFRTRSAGIWLQHPTLRAPTIDHVAFLGAEAPAVRGLRKIQFSESAEGESFDLEETINLQETIMQEKDIDQLPDSFWEKFKAKLGIGEKTELSEGGDKGASASKVIGLSEEAARSLITDAVTAAKAEFKAQLEAKDTKIVELETKVNGQIAGGVRAEIAAFVESIPSEKGKHLLKRAHVGDFLESLAISDAADEKPSEAICFSEGDGDDKTDHKFSRLEYAKTLINTIAPMVEFGEKFGNIVATKEADQMIDANRVEEMKKAAGVEAKGGKA